MQSKCCGVIPCSANEFSDPLYWRNFFVRHEAPFEWYGSFNELGEALTKYLKISDAIFQIGCGNSELASQLHDCGYRNVTSIDTDEAVIKKQIKNNKGREGLKFLCEPASNVDVESESINVVLDKGTLDALLPTQCDEPQQAEVNRMFKEVDRILIPNGRYVVVSLAQDQVVKCFIRYFTESHRYMIRIQKVSNSFGFYMPVFLLVATKIRVTLQKHVLEFMHATNCKAERCESIDELYKLVKAKQEYAWFVHCCQRKLLDEISLVMCANDGMERYKIVIVDDPDAPKISEYSVFIVPTGRDNEWLFATKKGRAFLRSRCDVSRLAVVFLYRSQIYGDFPSIKSELDEFIAEFYPRPRGRISNTKISYITLETDLPMRVIEEGESAVNGSWAVEEVAIEGKFYRRLAFFASQNLMQTEVLLKEKKKNRIVVDLDVLTSEYHETMVAALAFAFGSAKITSVEQIELRVAVLGLGGGALPSYLCRHLTNCRIIAVEYDEAVVEIAVKYFGLVRGSRGVDVRIENAIDFVKRHAYKKKKDDPALDVLMVDIAGSLDDQGMYCPPACFVTMNMLHAYRYALSQSGVLVLNVVTRDEEMSLMLKRNLDEIFPSVFSSTNAETINEVLICCKSKVDLSNVKNMLKPLKSKNEFFKLMAENVDRLKELTK